MSEGTSFCYSHPKEFVVGVCAFCLNERLLILASKQPRRLSSPKSATALTTQSQKPNLCLFDVFHFLNRLRRFRRRKPHNSDHEASTSHEDSFISIKLDGNGVGSWEKSKPSKDSMENCSHSWKHDTRRKEAKERETRIRRGIENGKRHSSPTWEKRIGSLFQLIRWWKNRSNKSGGAVCHVGSKVEGVRRRKGWIRSLTKKRMTTTKAARRRERRRERERDHKVK